MPVCNSLIILVSILFFAMLVAHDLTAASEESGQSAACHCLVTVPVPLSIADFAIILSALAVHAWPKWVSVFSAESIHVTRCNDDWLWIFVVNFSLVRLTWSVYVLDDWLIFRNIIFVISVSLSCLIKDALVCRIGVLRDIIECGHTKVNKFYRIF